jgi:hypothetical protein
MLPELAGPVDEPTLVGEYSSSSSLMGAEELAGFLRNKLPGAVAANHLA